MSEHMFLIKDSHGYDIGVIQTPFALYSEGADNCVFYAVKNCKGYYFAKTGCYTYHEIEGMHDVADDVPFLDFYN